MGDWFSIEVMNGPSSAGPWVEAYSDILFGIALSHGASDWEVVRQPWGAVLEFEFEDEAAWERFREVTTVQAALDAVPDPVNGLLVHRGRGGSSGARWPRRPRPLAGSGAAALPVPEDEPAGDEVAPPAQPAVGGPPTARRDIPAWA
ncbi:MAG TPA: hypothetical protein VFH45_06690 [Acidimicrobiales bacterium]|nr:hypothetical protein [Acidimicrobiales bacterium]